MNHRFYSKSEKEQKLIQIKIGGLAVLANLVVAAISVFSGLYFLIFLSFVITLSIIAPFFDVPALKEKGKLKYYSSLFIVENEKNGVIVVHGGSLFDYVFVLDKNLKGKQRTNFILQQYLEGLLNLIETCEGSQNNLVKIKGTTYILNQRTANKLGFKVVETDFIQNFLLIFNYMNILVASSFAKKRLSFPKLINIKTFEGELHKLIEHKEFMIELNKKLKYIISNKG